MDDVGGPIGVTHRKGSGCQGVERPQCIGCNDPVSADRGSVTLDGGRGANVACDSLDFGWRQLRGKRHRDHACSDATKISDRKTRRIPKPQ